MTIKLYNTMSREKEVFTPIDANNVRIYACGPTVYNYVHIGNGRMNVVFDVLYRLLKHYYPKVTYVSNITDIDDKIMNTAKEKGISTKELSEHYMEEFFSDIQSLGCLKPDYTPKATEYIPQQIKMIETLIANGHAYEAEGHVLFNVPSYEGYGCLSRRPRDEQIAGARVEVAPYKRDPADFILWKPSTEDQPGWDSPWGFGRPGWHLECSVMSTDLLGENFDIHGGGQDLTFPHHENEIAQSCCANKGSSFANYWIHNGFLQANGEKMSKSLGNFFTVRELLEKYDGEVIRYVLMSAQYRQPLDFTMTQLDEAKGVLNKYYTLLRELEEYPDISISLDEAFASMDFLEKDLDECSDMPYLQFLYNQAIDALSNDLNTPQFLNGVMAKVYSHVKSYVSDGKAINNDWSDETEKSYFNTENECIVGKAVLKELMGFVGILQKTPDEWFNNISGLEITPDLIEELITERIEAKKGKNYARADEIRNELADKGIILEDGPTGTTWKRG